MQKKILTFYVVLIDLTHSKVNLSCINLVFYLRVYKIKVMLHNWGLRMPCEFP